MTKLICPDGAGSENNPDTPIPPTYTPPDLCVGTFTISQGECADVENKYQESLAAQVLNISGAPLNVFKLLGVHEQGRLIDLTGIGSPLASSGDPAAAYTHGSDGWTSLETGLSVVQTPAYLGYDFGMRTTSFGQLVSAPGIADIQHITSLRIKQNADAKTRALQIRIESSNGRFTIKTNAIQYVGVGDGDLSSIQVGSAAKIGLVMLFADSPTAFTVMLNPPVGSPEILGTAVVGRMFNSQQISLMVNPGGIPFQAGDSFSIPVDLDWQRVDVVNLPNIANPVLIPFRATAAARYWRIVPTSFAGVLDDQPWRVDRLEMFDYQSTTLDNIQDPLFMENRDRDYSNASIQMKVQYTPFDQVSDMSKFGFQMTDVYSFSTSFAEMVRKLGRPIVVGDVLELPSELEYDHHLRPIKKFLEVTDTGWAADGYTTGWKPIIFRFQAQQLIPSMETRDIVGTADTQLYSVDDENFFNVSPIIQTDPLIVSDANAAEAYIDVPKTGTNSREYASGTNRFQQPGSYDGVGLYMEDGMPPDGQPYTTGYEKLPDVGTAKDGSFFRLEYTPDKNLPARLYKFSGVKQQWLHVSTDRRKQTNSHKPSQLAMFDSSERISLTGKF